MHLRQVCNAQYETGEHTDSGGSAVQEDGGPAEEGPVHRPDAGHGDDQPGKGQPAAPVQECGQHGHAHGCHPQRDAAMQVPLPRLLAVPCNHLQADSRSK